MIFVLLIGLLIQLAICYKVFNKDIFSPSAIISEVFIISTLACIYNIEEWGVSLSGKTVLVILGGNLIFILTSAIIHKFFNKKYKKEPNNITAKKLSKIKIPIITLLITTILYILFSIVFIRIATSLISTFNQTTINETSVAMQMYRKEMMENNIALPGWLATTSSIFEAGVYVIIYILINNLIVDRKDKKNILLLICIVTYLISSAFTAQRTTILIAFLYSLFVTYFLINRQFNISKKINGKFIRRGLIIVIIFLSLFGVTRGIFGRSTKNTTIESLTYYMGNSIESLDLFIEKPTERNIPGEELFNVYYQVLSKYGLAETPKSVNLEYRRNKNGGIAGNIYTAYRYYIHDFGYGSIIIFQIIIAIICGIWYEKLIRRDLIGIDYSFIIYSWMIAYSLFRFSLMNSFFAFMAHFIFSYWYKTLMWAVLFRTKINKKRN